MTAARPISLPGAAELKARLSNGAGFDRGMGLAIGLCEDPDFADAFGAALVNQVSAHDGWFVARPAPDQVVVLSNEPRGVEHFHTHVSFTMAQSLRGGRWDGTRPPQIASNSCEHSPDDPDGMPAIVRLQKYGSTLLDLRSVDGRSIRYARQEGAVRLGHSLIVQAQRTPHCRVRVARFPKPQRAVSFAAEYPRQLSGAASLPRPCFVGRPARGEVAVIDSRPGEADLWDIPDAGVGSELLGEPTFGLARRGDYIPRLRGFASYALAYLDACAGLDRLD